MAYKNWDQFLELMGILKSLEEQIRTIHMKEPVFIHLQDMIEKPFQLQIITRKSKFESKMRAIAYQQLRICNLQSCIEAVEYDGTPYSFNLTLNDPLRQYLDNESKAISCEGQYTVEIGRQSSLKEGHKKGLASVSGSINGFTRLWAGVLPAETVGLVENLTIGKELIAPLWQTFYNPDVRSDWDY